MSFPVRAGWFAGKAPQDLGVRNERLKPCPGTPNCVSSQDVTASRIEPLAFSGDAATAWRRLAAVLAGMPRMRVVESSERYLRAEATSRVFGFVDDVEFLLDASVGIIHVRSASRVGYSDLGVNRDRVESIRRLMAADRTP